MTTILNDKALHETELFTDIETFISTSCPGLQHMWKKTKQYN